MKDPVRIADRFFACCRADDGADPAWFQILPPVGEYPGMRIRRKGEDVCATVVIDEDAIGNCLAAFRAAASSPGFHGVLVDREHFSLDLDKPSDAMAWALDMEARDGSLWARFEFTPPGREAYPGDVFYLHSRLLERCAKLSDDLGAGSMTGLPIIETKANDVSAYIPTNVISITDGQIFLQSDLFNANQRPAVDVGISVSRVGGDAQVKSIKKVSGTLKLELAQYRSLEAFAMFASDLDAASRRQLDRGARLTELLKQPQYDPYPVEEQVVSIWAGTNGKLDSIEVEDVLRFERDLLDYLKRNTSILDTLRETNVLDDDTLAELEKVTDAFVLEFQGGKGQAINKPGHEEVEAANVEDVNQEKIVKGRRG
jgi:hypothetical protein